MVREDDWWVDQATAIRISAIDFPDLAEAIEVLSQVKPSMLRTKRSDWFGYYPVKIRGTSFYIYIYQGEITLPLRDGQKQHTDDHSQIAGFFEFGVVYGK